MVNYRNSPAKFSFTLYLDINGFNIASNDRNHATWVFLSLILQNVSYARARGAHKLLVFYILKASAKATPRASTLSYDFLAVRSRVDGRAKLTAPANLSISVTQYEASRRSPSPPSPAIISPVGAFTISPDKRHRPLSLPYQRRY